MPGHSLSDRSVPTDQIDSASSFGPTREEQRKRVLQALARSQEVISIAHQLQKNKSSSSTLESSLEEASEEQTSVHTSLPEDLSDLLQIAPDGYLFTDPGGIIRTANRATALLLGIAHSFLPGKPIINYLALSDRQVIRRALIELQSSGDLRTESRTELIQIVPRKGEPFEAILRFTGVYDTQLRTISGVRWILSDLSDRRRSETERYRLLVDAVQDYAIFLLNADGQISSWNRGAEEIFGYSEIEVLGRSFGDLFLPEERHKMAALELSEARSSGRYMEENWMIRKNGQRFWSQGVLIALPGSESGRAGFAKIVRDNTLLRHIQEDLRLREARMSLALQAAQAGAWDWVIESGQVVWSEDYWDICGLNKEVDLPSFANWAKSVHPDDVDKATQAVFYARDNQIPLVNEYRAAKPTADGTERWLLSLGQPVTDPTGHVYRMTGITMDITERKQAEVQLEARVALRTAELDRLNQQLMAETREHRRTEASRRELIQKLVGIQEDERRRLSRELHDQTGQHLTALALGLRILEDTARPHDALQPQLTRLRTIADALASDLHRLAVELRPTAIDDFGFLRALRGHIDEWTERTGIRTDIHIHGITDETRFTNAIETSLYRVVQESLTNVAKHSGASRVEIILQRQEGVVTLIVEDNGHGFDASTISEEHKSGRKSQRLGLIGMQERVQLIGGTISLESSPGGGGTTLIVRIPVTPM